MKKKNIYFFFIKEENFNDLNKIILSQSPSIGIYLLYEIGFLFIILPEITYLQKIDIKKGSYHKDNFIHTLEVLKNISKRTHSFELRWSAILHDIGKSIAKKYSNGIGWVFHTHERIGARIIPYIFHRLKLPQFYTIKYIQKIVQFSSRPITLASYETTESAIRRLITYLTEEIEDLLLFCKEDITTINFERKNRYINHILFVENKIKNLYIKDIYIKSPIYISGIKIMNCFQLQSSPQIGIIKKALIEAILVRNLLANEFTSMYSFMNTKNKIFFFLK